MPSKPTPMHDTLIHARPLADQRVEDVTGGEEPIVAELTGQELADFREHWVRNRAKLPYYLEQGRLTPQAGDEWRVHIDGILRFLDDYGDFGIQLMNYPNTQLTVLFSERYQQAFVVAVPDKPPRPGATGAKHASGLWARVRRLFGG